MACNITAGEVYLKGFEHFPLNLGSSEDKGTADEGCMTKAPFSKIVSKMGTIPGKELRREQGLYLERAHDEKEQAAGRRAAMVPGPTITLKAGAQEKAANYLCKESNETHVLNSLQKKKEIQ